MALFFFLSPSKDSNDPLGRDSAVFQDEVSGTELFLHKAEKLYLENKIITPAHENALLFTRKLLAVSPDHLEGRALLLKIAGFLSDNVRQAMESSDLQAAASYLDNAVQLNSEYGMELDGALAELESQLAEKRATQEKQTQVALLYEKTSQLYSDGLILQPVDENAFTCIKALLEISPDHSKGQGPFERHWQCPVR